jgi:hypothetical protein
LTLDTTEKSMHNKIRDHLRQLRIRKNKPCKDDKN